MTNEQLTTTQIANLIEQINRLDSELEQLRTEMNQSLTMLTQLVNLSLHRTEPEL
jgi:uncharacterized protein (UPF0335 family)